MCEKDYFAPFDILLTIYIYIYIYILKFGLEIYIILDIP